MGGKVSTGTLVGGALGGPMGAQLGAAQFGSPGGILGDSQNAGILGVGQFKGQSYDPNADAFNNDQTQSAETMFAKQAAQAQARKAPTSAAAQLAKANLANSANINMSPQDQFRAQQQTLAGQLAGQAAGTGPSLAQNQLRQGTDRNIQQAMALAASQRGGNSALGLRQLGQNVSMANQQAAADASNLRLQEQMAAQNQLGGVLSGARTQDIGLAGDQAQLQQQAALANQAAKNQFSLQQGQFQQATNLANQQANLQQQQLNDQAGQFYNGGLMNAAEANRNAQMALEQLKVQNALGVNSANQAGYQAASTSRGNLIGNIGQGVAAMASDEELKKNVEDGDGSLEKFLSALQAKQYEYKDPKFGEGKTISPMAQDIEKTDLGDSLVMDTPQGKMVNYAKAGGLMLASAAMLNNRMGDLETKMKKAFAGMKKNG